MLINLIVITDKGVFYAIHDFNNHDIEEIESSSNFTEIKVTEKQIEHIMINKNLNFIDKEIVSYKHQLTIQFEEQIPAKKLLKLIESSFVDDILRQGRAVALEVSIYQYPKGKYVIKYFMMNKRNAQRFGVALKDFS